MENKYKALIKQELKSVSWMFAYFGMVFTLFIVILNMGLNRKYSCFLEYPIRNMNSRTFNFLDSMDCSRGLMPFIAVGIIVLVILQFKDYKDGECGRFLRVLPVKSEKYFLIKVLCGVMSYTIPFIIMVVGVYWIKFINKDWIASIYNMTGIKHVYDLVDGNAFIAKTLLIYYFIITADYMFLVFMQYLISWPRVSAVIGSMITVAPFFVALNVNKILAIYDPYSGKESFRIDEILAMPWLYGEANEYYVSGYGNSFRVWLRYIEQIELKLILLIIVSGIFFVFAYMKSRDYKIETLDILIPMRLVRTIFCTGVIICSSLIPTFIVSRILFAEMQIDFKFLISSMLCAVLGGFISLKVSRLGNRKKGGVGYEEV